MKIVVLLLSFAIFFSFAEEKRGSPPAPPSEPEVPTSKALLEQIVGTPSAPVDSSLSEPVANGPVKTEEKLALVPDSIVPNECFGQSGKPFKKYSSFGLGTDGNFYGDISGTLKPIQVELVYKDADRKEVDSAATIVAFKKKQRILSQCNSDGSLPDASAPAAASSSHSPGSPTPHGPRPSAGRKEGCN
ncbi:MAG: hypothetical protein LC672_02175, partial [Acidobacteria bacterium]|nr:hypothetical protein [Acidobacteriota bacterium]